MSPSGGLEWAVLNRIPIVGALLGCGAARVLNRRAAGGNDQAARQIARALVDSPHREVRREALISLTSAGLADRLGVEIVEPLVAACTDSDSEISLKARTGVASLSRRDQIDYLCDWWAESRQPLLADLIRTRASSGGSSAKTRILTALLTDDFDRSGNLEPEALRVLIEALDDTNPSIAKSAARHLAELVSEDAHEEVCQRILAGAVGSIRQLAATAGYAPRDSIDRAMFFYLTGQSDRLDFWDPGRVFLRRACDRATAGQRQDLLHTMQHNGHQEDVDLVINGSQEHRARTPSRDEFILCVDLLAESGHWADLWARVCSFPLDVAIAALGRLRAGGWQPQKPGERQTFSKAIDLAADLEDHKNGGPRLHLPPCLMSRQLSVAGRVHDLAFSPDHTLLAVATSRAVVIWDYRCDVVVGEVRSGGRPIGKVTWISPDSIVFSENSRDSRENCRIFVSSPLGGTPRTLGSSRGRVTTLLTVSDHRMVSTSRDGRIVFWNLDNEKAFKSFHLLNGQWPRSAALSQDGRNLAIVADGVATAEVSDIFTSQAFFGRPVLTCASFLPDGNLITGSHSGQIDKWFVEPNRLRVRIPIIGHHRSPVAAVKALGKHGLVVSAETRGTIQLRRFVSDELIASVQVAGKRVSALAVSADDQHMAVGHPEGSVTLWDFRPLELALSLDEPLNALRPGLCDATIALLKGGSLDRITSQHLKLVEVLLRKRAQSEVSIVVPAAANGSCPMPRSSRG